MVIMIEEGGSLHTNQRLPPMDSSCYEPFRRSASLSADWSDVIKKKNCKDVDFYSHVLPVTEWDMRNRSRSSDVVVVKVSYVFFWRNFICWMLLLVRT